MNALTELKVQRVKFYRLFVDKKKQIEYIVRSENITFDNLRNLDTKLMYLPHALYHIGDLWRPKY